MKKRKARVPMGEWAVNKVYPFIIEYQRLHKGTSPTLYEIGKKFKRSAEWARLCLKILSSLNMIRVDYYKQRGILIVGK